MARTRNDITVLEIVELATGVGRMVGSIVLSIWGHPKCRIHGVLIGMTLTMLGILLFGFGHDPDIWALALFFGMSFVSIINGSS